MWISICPGTDIPPSSAFAVVQNCNVVQQHTWSTWGTWCLRLRNSSSYLYFCYITHKNDLDDRMSDLSWSYHLYVFNYFYIRYICPTMKLWKTSVPCASSRILLDKFHQNSPMRSWRCRSYLLANRSNTEESSMSLRKQVSKFLKFRNLRDAWKIVKLHIIYVLLFLFWPHVYFIVKSIWSHTTSLSVHWGDMDLMEGLSSG